MAALARALRAVVPALPGYDVEIVERHHRAKVDAPSGTALALGEVVSERRGATAAGGGARRTVRAPWGRAEGRRDRHPRACAAAAWIGEHAVLLAGPHESLEFTHVAHDRDAFAEGALAALRFLAGARPAATAGGRARVTDRAASR